MTSKGNQPVPFLDNLDTPTIVASLDTVFPDRIHELRRAHNNSILVVLVISIWLLRLCLSAGRSLGIRTRRRRSATMTPPQLLDDDMDARIEGEHSTCVIAVEDEVAASKEDLPWGGQSRH